MLFGGATILLIALSLYWIVSTLVAMVIVTLPGMYPGRALQLAGDLVVGRRLRIMLRVVWIFVVIFIFWALILLPMIVLDSKIKSAIPAIEWMPIVPLTSMLLTSVSIVFLAVYIYVLYRKIVADEAPPA